VLRANNSALRLLMVMYDEVRVQEVMKETRMESIIKVKGSQIGKISNE